MITLYYTFRGSNSRLSVLVELLQFYLIHTRHIFMRPTNPFDAPTYPTGATNTKLVLGLFKSIPGYYGAVVLKMR